MADWKFALSSAKTAPNSAPILLKGEITDNLRTAAMLGYDAIEIHTRENVELNIPAIRSVSTESGCRIGMIVTGRLNTEVGASLVNPNPILEQMAMRGMEKYIHMAGELGADIVLGWIRGKAPDGKAREIYVEKLGERICKLGECAKKSDVKINIEVINRYETNVFVNADETLKFLHTYNPKNCLVHLDTFHMGIEETDPAEAIRKCRGELGYVHVADNTRIYPGKGTIDFKKIFRALQEIDYRGLISVECLPKPNEMEAARKALENIKNVVAQLQND